MPAVYENYGLRFEYPENWKLDASSAADGEVTVYSPGGAFWSVVRCGALAELHRYADETLKTMRQEYDELDAEPAEETVAGHRLTGYDVHFFCLDLTNTMLIRVARTAEDALLILCQADDLEFSQIGSVFRAMTASLLSHTPPNLESAWPHD